MVLFGQFVVGPPGAGKTTYCQGMSMFISRNLGRKCAVVNLDFANDSPPYEADIDVRDIISIETAMETESLGPNGGLLYCMEHLLANYDWLEQQLLSLVEGDGEEEEACNYVIFDCPGQVELYSHHICVQDLLKNLQGGKLSSRLTCVQLIDSFYCSQPATFISAVLLATTVMLRLGLPHVNILSKIDLLAMYGPLPFTLDFFTELTDLAPLARYIGAAAPKDDYSDDGVEEEEDTNSSSSSNIVDDSSGSDFGSNTNESSNSISNNINSNSNSKADPRSILHSKFKKMSELLCELVDDYGLVSFVPVNIEDKETVHRALVNIDLANGYSMASHQADSIIAEQKQRQQTGSSAYGSGSQGHNAESRLDSIDSIFRMTGKALMSESSTLNSLSIQEKYGGMNQTI